MLNIHRGMFATPKMQNTPAHSPHLLIPSFFFSGEMRYADEADWSLMAEDAAFWHCSF